MGIRLHVTDAEIDSPEPERKFAFAAGPVLLGRSRTNHVVFGGPLVSRVHLEFHERDGGWVVLPRGGLLPTVLNGESLPRDLARAVADGDQVVVGGFRIDVGLDTSQAARSDGWGVSAQTDTWSAERLAGGWGAGPAAWLEIVLEGAPGGPVQLPLVESGRNYVLGRSSDCDLCLHHGAVSRRHLSLRREGSEVVVTNLGARNPALLNDVPVEGSKRMRPGDVVSIGPLRLLLERRVTPPPAPSRSGPSPSALAWGAQALAPSQSAPPQSVPSQSAPSQNVPSQNAPPQDVAPQNLPSHTVVPPAAASRAVPPQASPPAVSRAATPAQPSPTPAEVPAQPVRRPPDPTPAPSPDPPMVPPPDAPSRVTTSVSAEQLADLFVNPRKPPATNGSDVPVWVYVVIAAVLVTLTVVVWVVLA